MWVHNIKRWHLPKKNKTEQTIEYTQKIQWAKEAMQRMMNDAKQLETEEDVVVFERNIIKPFVSNIGMLSEGREEQNDYSLEEYKDLLACVEEIQKEFATIEKELNIEPVGSVSSNIEYLIRILKMRVSYVGFNEYKKSFGLNK